MMFSKLAESYAGFNACAISALNQSRTNYKLRFKENFKKSILEPRSVITEASTTTNK